MSRITKSAAERRQEIIETARSLFTKNGFEETQISDIAHEINIAQGLVYNYFKSKNELLYAVIDELADERRQVIDALLQNAKGTALERLLVLLDSQPDMGVFGKLRANVAMDTAIAAYSSNKMSLAVMPVLLSLAEQGNLDGSWSCKYPKETVVFILHGLSGFVEDVPQIGSDKRQVIVDMILRVLDASYQRRA